MNQTDPKITSNNSPFNPANSSGPVRDPALADGPVPDPATQKIAITPTIIIVRIILSIGLIAGTWALSGLINADIIYNNSVFIDNMQSAQGTIIETYHPRDYDSRNVKRHGPEYRTKKLLKVRYEVDGKTYEEDVNVTYALVEKYDFSNDKVLAYIDTNVYQPNMQVALYYDKNNPKDLRLADDLMIRHMQDTEDRFLNTKLPHYVGIFFYVILWIIILGVVFYLIITIF